MPILCRWTEVSAEGQAGPGEIRRGLFCSVLRWIAFLLPIIRPPRLMGPPRPFHWRTPTAPRKEKAAQRRGAGTSEPPLHPGLTLDGYQHSRARQKSNRYGSPLIGRATIACMSDDAERPENRPTPSTPQEPPRILDSQEILKGQREVFIIHNGEQYRLRVTSNGRLYLTK
jgi:hemin uptake protein HemP